MKIIYLLSLLALTACRKNSSSTTTPTQTKYNCVCETKTIYTDHCGRDSSLSASAIYGTEKSEAEKECSGKNSSTTDSYTTTVRQCELK
jgi:hypothetical protein